MATIRYADSVYSFRANTSLIAQFVDTTPYAATLSQIEVELSDAAKAFYQGRYPDSINLYKAAGVIIYQYSDLMASQFSSPAWDSLLQPRPVRSAVECERIVHERAAHFFSAARAGCGRCLHSRQQVRLRSTQQACVIHTSSMPHAVIRLSGDPVFPNLSFPSTALRKVITRSLGLKRFTRRLTIQGEAGIASSPNIRHKVSLERTICPA